MPQHFSTVAFEHSLVTSQDCDDAKIALGSTAKSIKVFSKSGALIKTLQGHEGGVWCLKLIRDILVTGSTDKTIKYWNLETGECFYTFTGHESTIRTLLILEQKSGNLLVIGGCRDSTISVVLLNESTKECQEKFRLTGHSNSIHSLAGHENILISASYDGTLRVWDLLNGTCKFILDGHFEKVYAVDYCPKLEKVLSGSMDSTAKVWCAKTGKLMNTLEGHTELVIVCKIVDEHFFTASADCTVKIWSLDGKCKYTIQEEAVVRCLEFDETRQVIFTGTDLGIKAWKMDGNLLSKIYTGSCAWFLDLKSDILVSATSENEESDSILRIFNKPLETLDKPTTFSNSTE